MKTFEVTLFVLGLPYNENNTRVVTIEANSQDEAEQKAHDWYVSDGWGVYNSKEIAEEEQIIIKVMADKGHVAQVLRNLADIVDSAEKEEEVYSSEFDGADYFAEINEE